MQSKKANFDASHELEELLLEDNPLKARQRKVQDINNLSAEMRQMEEQYVCEFRFASSGSMILSCFRFTSYDFRKMQRRSYYPQNQIVSTATATSSIPASSRPVTPMTTVGADGIHEEYLAKPKPPRSFEGDMMQTPTTPMSMNQADYMNEKQLHQRPGIAC